MPAPLIIPAVGLLARGLVRYAPIIAKSLPRISSSLSKGVTRLGNTVKKVKAKGGQLYDDVAAGVRQTPSVIKSKVTEFGDKAKGMGQAGFNKINAFSGRVGSYLGKKKWDIVTDVGVSYGVGEALDNTNEVLDEIQSLNDKLDGVGDQGSENATANTVAADTPTGEALLPPVDFAEALIPVIEAIDRLPAGIAEALAELPKVGDVVPEIAPAPALDHETQSIAVCTSKKSISMPIADATDDAGQSIKAFGEDAKATFLSIAEQGRLSADGIKGAFKQLAGSLLRDQILPKLLGAGNPLMGVASGGFSKILGFASGGKPPVGVPSLVGERGPELFIPDISGRIVNANNTRGMLAGGGAGVTQNIMFTTDVQNSVRAEILNASPMIANQAAQSVMANMRNVRR